METETFFIGSYADRGSPSLMQAVLDGEGHLSVTPLSTEAENPSWVLAHPGGQILYAVEERVPDGGLAVFEKNGNRWICRCHLPAGSAPCHLSLDREAAFLFVSNYMDGTLDVWRLDSKGMPSARTQHLCHEGHGPNPERQEGPHIHSSLVLGDLVLVTDLGLDQVFMYRLNRPDGTLTFERSVRFPAGCGPRHMAVHPSHPGLLYVNAEMGGSVYVTRLEDGTILQTVSAVPADFGGIFTLSSIRFCGNTLYVGCRDHNAVTLFSLRPDGTLEEPVIFRHRQKTPRDIWMDDHWCITADQGSEGLTLLKREGEQLTETAFVSTPGISPTCIIPR